MDDIKERLQELSREIESCYWVILNPKNSDQAVLEARQKAIRTHQEIRKILEEYPSLGGFFATLYYSKG